MTAASEDPDTSELDDGWGDPELEEAGATASQVEPKEAPPPSEQPPSRRHTPPARPLAPTVPDIDPAALDAVSGVDRKESRPTLPVINPLRFDIPDADED